MNSAADRLRKPVSAVGVGLRTAHIPTILQTAPDVPWFELLADNWLAPGGLNADYLAAVAERYPLTLHGVGLSLGGAEPLDRGYLARIRALMAHCGAHWYSEHASFARAGRHQFHDLCPLPYTEETVRHLASRILQVQDFLGERMLLENVSAYLRYKESDLSEGEFIRAVAETADCYLLVDINNLYVNQINHGSDALDTLRLLPAHRIREIHLAGHEQKQGFLLDTHSRPVADPVWSLYEASLSLFGAVPTLIEWDHDLPDWPGLWQEQQRASAFQSGFSAQPDVSKGAALCV